MHFYVFQKYVHIYRFFKCLYSSIIRISFPPSNHSSGTVKKSIMMHTPKWNIYRKFQWIILTILANCDSYFTLDPAAMYETSSIRVAWIAAFLNWSSVITDVLGGGKMACTLHRIEIITKKLKCLIDFDFKCSPTIKN